jgi:acyl-CoA thioesterase-1
MKRTLSLALLLLASACSVREAACGPSGTSSSPAVLPTAVTGDVSDPNAVPQFTIAYLGDSLTAGLGLLSSQTFPARIEEMFAAAGYVGIDTLNAGLSGDTSAGGLRRVENVLEPSVRILVVALGGNDALRGLTVGQTKENLRQIIDIAQSQGVHVMLCGMEAPTNLGEDYRTAFRDLYFDLLRSYQRQIVYVPFLLEGVAGKPELNQADGIHPNEAGAKVIADLLFPLLKGMVDQAGGGS